MGIACALVVAEEMGVNAEDVVVEFDPKAGTDFIELYI
jgi:hypothetical protein